jgi:hypothetical protein
MNYWVDGCTGKKRQERRQLVSQPYFEKSARMKLTLPKWELGSPPELSKIQSSIARVKTPHIGAFFISLESIKA